MKWNTEANILLQGGFVKKIWLKALSAFLMALVLAALPTTISAQPSEILDIDGRSVASFLNRDHTIVISFDGRSQNSLKALIKQAVSELASDVDDASYDAGFVPLEGFQILFVFDARSDIQSEFSTGTAKYNGKGKRLARRIVVNRAPGKISQGVGKVDSTLRKVVNQEIKGFISPDDIRIVSLFKNEWSVGRSEGIRPSTGRRIIKRAVIPSGRTYISFQNNGKSARFMQSIFANTNSGLQLGILNPSGQLTSHWVGMVPPMQVIETYANQKGLSLRGNQDEIVVEEGVDPFDALIENSIKYDYPDLKVSVTDLKEYTANLNQCIGKREYPSSKPLRDFFVKAFFKINHDVQTLSVALAKNDYFTVMSGRKPLLEFVDTSTVLLRKYYDVQAARFTGDFNGLSQEDKELHLTLRAVYEQVASMLKLEPRAAVDVDVEWQGRSLAEYEDHSYWSVILAAIKLSEKDQGYCGEIL